MQRELKQETSSAQQQIGLLNLRINDMVAQLNVALKTMLDENAALQKENVELKGKLQDKA